MPGHRRQPSIELLEFMGVVKENGTEQASLPNVFTPLSYDYVLVAKTIEDQERKAFRKQNEYIEELRKKNFKVTKIIDDHLVFYGIQAPKEVFKKYMYLLKVSDACNWSLNQNNLPLSSRIRIVHFILNHTPIRSGENLRDLMKANVFEARFCLHEKKKQKELKESWARWTACLQGQPITAVRNYFGEKVALYFLWLGWYTYLLITPALIGILVFLFGLSYFNESPLIKEVCESNRVMCPLCDKGCKVWKLSETCSYAKLSLLFDNNGTVFFAMFMAIWTTLFLEFWKRHRATYVCEWKVHDWSESEEEMILEIVNDADCKPKEYEHSYLHSTLVLICVTVMILVIIGLTHALVVFRVIVAVFLAKEPFESNHSNIGAMLAGALLHFLIITIMTRINRIVAMKLCEIEKTRSFSATEKSFTVKMFTFQFFTYFSSLFYVAFFLGRLCPSQLKSAFDKNYRPLHAFHCFKEERNDLMHVTDDEVLPNMANSGCIQMTENGHKHLGLQDKPLNIFPCTNDRINGHPGEYVRIAGQWRLEECHPSGCLTDLFIQMAIIMVLKQTISNVFEFTGPWFYRFLGKRKRPHKLQRKCATCYLKDESELKDGDELCDNCKLKDWHKNYRLTDVDSFSLFNEFLEMVIQFSFTTIFVAAFPLAPLFALINNVIEIRLDAIKMVTLERRMVPKKTNNIGIWIHILEAIGVLAVIANGLVIGVSSDFIPRLVYRYVYGPCVNGTATDCMEGYINNTLSIASMNDSRVRFEPNQMVTPDGFNATFCSYKDYRNSNFEVTPQFWLILAVRFAFVILFEHVLVICKFIAAWFVPAAPMQVKNDRLFDKLKRLKEELRSYKPDTVWTP